MMKAVAFALLFSVATLAHPTALWWGSDLCYPSPENTDNHCSDSQKSGFDWSDLANGDNWTFEGFNFVGFSPNDNEGSRCIKGTLSRDDDYSIMVDAVDTPFSVRNFHLSTSRDTDVLIKYDLADGSSCHQVAFCSPQGVDVTNDQCGGAVSVEFALPEQSEFGDCDLNIHRIDFDCSSGPKRPVAVSSHSLSSTTLTVPTPYTHSTSMTETPTTHSTPMTTSTVWTTRTFTVTKCPPTVTDCPDHSTELVTSTYSLSTTVCISSTETVATTTSPVGSTPAESTPSVVPAPCPGVVPKCMNTWLSIPQCDSNSDTACFCPSSEFADKVKSCIHAWSTSEEESQSALSYFAGICAPYVPKNPSIVDIPPTSSPASSVYTPTPSQVTVTSATTTPCTTITWASQTVTVPQVWFSTITVSSTTSVCLVPGVPTNPPSTTSHKTTPASTSTTTYWKTQTWTLPTTTAPKPIAPTPTEVFSNTGSKTFLSSMWAGMAIFILGLL